MDRNTLSVVISHCEEWNPIIICRLRTLNHAWRDAVDTIYPRQSTHLYQDFITCYCDDGNAHHVHWFIRHDRQDQCGPHWVQFKKCTIADLTTEFSLNTTPGTPENVVRVLLSCFLPTKRLRFSVYTGPPLTHECHLHYTDIIMPLMRKLLT